jgi:hypothetical protein
MARVCKPDGEQTFAGTRGNDEVAPVVNRRQQIRRSPHSRARSPAARRLRSSRVPQLGRCFSLLGWSSMLPYRERLR